MRIAARVDADETIGAGHFMRTLALLRALPGDRRIFTCALPESLAKQARDFGIEVMFLPEAPAKIAGVDFLIVDGYQFTPEDLRRLHPRVLYFDDLGELDAYPVRIILNQNASARAEWYAGKTQARLLLGLDYVILRDEIRNHPRRVHSGSVRSIGITMGASDPPNASEPLAAALVRRGYEVEVAVGPMNPHRSRLETTKATLADAPPMAEFLTRHDLILTAAGSTLWEAASLGVPTLSVVLAPNQAPSAAAAEARGLTVNLGSFEGLSEEHLVGTLAQLTPESLQAMAQAGPHAVDGRGAERVRQALEDELNS